MKNSIKKNYTFIMFIVVFIGYAICWYCFDERNIIYGDGYGYYQYFVRVFITHDFVNSEMIKYPVGTTFLQLPFLLLAKYLSYCMKIDYENGLNTIFQASVYISSVFYCILGLYFIYKVLIRKFSSKISVITCGCILWGTMLLDYATKRASYSHVYAFFACSMFMCFVEYYEQNYGKSQSAVKLVLDITLGIMLGLVTLIRSTNIIIGVLYLLYSVTSFQTLRTRLTIVFRWKVLIQFLSFVCIYAIQMYCWKLQTGHFLVYSYGKETFIYATNPQIIKVLFSDAKGLFIYSPILFLSVIGMISERKKNREFSLSQWIVFASLTYIVSAWWCWWLGYCYGARMYCDVLCIFAIPIASLFETMSETHYINGSEKSILLGKCIGAGFFAISMFFVILNLIWINGNHNGTISENFGTWIMLRDQIGKFLFP